jgi:hypothetical protein
LATWEHEAQNENDKDDAGRKPNLTKALSWSSFFCSGISGIKKCCEDMRAVKDFLFALSKEVPKIKIDLQGRKNEQETNKSQSQK